MRLISFGLLTIIPFLPVITFGENEDISGVPIKYISSCHIDLNGDGLSDLAILMESNAGRELVILCGSKDGYQVGLVKMNIDDMYMTCEFESTLTGIRDNDSTDTEVEVETSGTYIQLYTSESASLAIYWSDGKFRDIWTSD